MSAVDGLQTSDIEAFGIFSKSDAIIVLFDGQQYDR